MTRTTLAKGTIFDGTGHLVTPGLFDCHVHFMADELDVLDAVVFSGTDLDVSDMRPRVARVFQGGTRVA
ncbi:hypothetical protein [Ilumatobacter sp.]|uniref:hypothetical protein n=1 Tax=Ilumatobacter sp. TaxID=1967498 RepID=UPI0037509351